MRKVSVGKVMQKRNGVPTGKIASWYYRFTDANYDENGKQKYTYQAGFKSKRDAEIAGQEAFDIEYGLNRNNAINQKIMRMPFQDYVNRYWWEGNIMMWKPSTAEGYRKKLNNYIFPAFGNKTLGNINAGMLQEYFYNLYLNTAFAVSSIDNIRALLSLIFKYAVNNNHLTINPMLNVKKPNLRIESSVDKNKQKRYAIPDEILDKIKKRFPEGSAAHIPFWLCLDAGLRSAEALALTWDDIDFKKHCIYITELKTAKLSPWSSHDDSYFFALFMVWLCLHRYYHKQDLTEKRNLLFRHELNNPQPTENLPNEQFSHR